MVSVSDSVRKGKCAVHFTCKAPEGRNVALAGSFNDWDPASCLMRYLAQQECYGCTIELPGGSYEYKFVVDGDWLLDEENPNFSANDFGTLNSVFTVKPE